VQVLSTSPSTQTDHRQGPDVINFPESRFARFGDFTSSRFLTSIAKPVQELNDDGVSQRRGITVMFKVARIEYVPVAGKDPMLLIYLPDQGRFIGIMGEDNVRIVRQPYCVNNLFPDGINPCPLR